MKRDHTFTQDVADAFADIISTREGEVLREGVKETPMRAARAWFEKTAGYAQDPADYFKMFEVQADAVKGMVLVKDIQIESMCEHHLERIWGVAHIAYVPHGHVLGLSKLSRIADVYARRMQVQERLTADIADCLMHYLSPLGVGVVIEARHACMEARGICRRGQVTVTSELRGVFYSDATTRGEFLSLARASQPF